VRQHIKDIKRLRKCKLRKRKHETDERKEKGWRCDSNGRTPTYKCKALSSNPSEREREGKREGREGRERGGEGK
jgi:hypothetical protein